MGNSEVGHLNIGAGRVIYQDFTRIDRAIETGEFATNPVLVEAVATARRNRCDRSMCWGWSRPAACTATSGRSRRWCEWPPQAARRASACTLFSTDATLRRRSAAASLAMHGGGLRRSPGLRASPTSSAATTPWIATIAGSASQAAYELIVDGVRRLLARLTLDRRWPRPTRGERTTSSSSRR